VALTYNIPLAGTRFGLTQKELAERYGLTDDQAEGLYTEFGETQPMKMTETTYKGRGTGTLGYQVGGQPTRTETIFESFTPDYEPPKTTEEAPQAPQALPQQELANRLLSSFIGEKGTEGIVGGTALGRALEYGYTPEDITSMAKQEGLTFGPNATRGLELPYSSDLTKARGPQADPNYPNALGLSAVKRLEDQGYSQQAILSLAGEQGIKFGEDASSYLGGAPRVSAPVPKPAQASSSAPTLKPWTAPRSSSPSDITSHINVGGQASAGYMGKAAVERAKAAGLSSAEIQRQAAAKGLKFGSDVSF
jgi:hypothetical protein